MMGQRRVCIMGSLPKVSSKDKKHGKGCMYLNKNCYYSGVWNENKKNGDFTIVSEKGTTVIKYENDGAVKYKPESAD